MPTHYSSHKRSAVRLVDNGRALYTAAQVRELDRLAIAGGVSGFSLMQRAAHALLSALLRNWPGTRELLVLAGTGNNGGDGYLLALLARKHGLRVQVLQLGDAAAIRGDALSARQKALENGVEAEPFSAAGLEDLMRSHRRSQREGERAAPLLLVDAMLGTGISGDLREGYRQAIELINASGLNVLAVDVPSGLCSDTGRIIGAAVRAQLTVSFIGLKQGMFTGFGPDCCGEIVLDELEVPHEVWQSPVAMHPSCERLDIHGVLSLIPRRSASAHKGQFGHVLVVGGDSGFGGAALMSAEAAARTGAGTISLVTRPQHVSAALARRPEIMVHGLDEAMLGNAAGKSEWLSQVFRPLVQRASVIVVGPGLGRSHWSRTLMKQVLTLSSAFEVPLVVDADGLNLLALDADIAGLAGLPRHSWVLTPHPGEAGRLLGRDNAAVQADRFAAVRELQHKYGGVCLLKGAGTVLACPVQRDVPGHDEALHLAVCTEGNPGMASGGMGDVLSGVIAGFVAQGLSLADAARCAVCVHGESADLAAAKEGQRGMLATDLLPYLRSLSRFYEQD